MQDALGFDVAHKGARTRVVVTQDADGEVINLLGPEDAKPARPHARQPGHAQPGHAQPHAKPHGDKHPHPAAPAQGRVQGQVPRPADADCHPVHGKVPGPKNHLLCSVHLYVVDTDTNQVIANSLADYQAAHPHHHGDRKHAG